MSGEVSDSELIVASLSDPGLFSVIFERHFSSVFGFVGSAVAASEVEDIAAEAFVRAFEQRDRYNPQYPSAKPWLLGIASNLIAGHYRTAERRGRAYQRLFARELRNDGFDEDASSRVDASAMNPLLERALSILRPQETAVVVLFALEGLSYAEISAALEIPEGTVRSRLSRARARLRNFVAASGEFDQDDTNE